MNTVEPEVKWSQDEMIEVSLNEPDDFLKVRETLTRIGVASRKEKKLYQSCHILVLKQDDVVDIAPLNQIKVLAYKEKGDWILEQKYNIGKRSKTTVKED